MMYVQVKSRTDCVSAISDLVLVLALTFIDPLAESSTVVKIYSCGFQSLCIRILYGWVPVFIELKPCAPFVVQC